MRVTEAAERLSLSPLTLYSWVSQRKIPHHKIGQLLRFTEEDLAAVVERVEAKEE